MSDPTEPRREHESTYFVQDRNNAEEMTRLNIQDKMLTAGMGGALPELADPSRLRRVLDVGCGAGEWLREAARTYPMIEKLVGADVSGKMITYARAQTDAEHLSERVEFRTMDALRLLDFPRASFDLVNQRLGISWLRTWEWPKLLVELQRVTQLEGIIRITEGNASGECNSPALTKLYTILFTAFYRSGHLFTATSEGVTGKLERLMTEHGIQDVQTEVHNIVYRAGTELGQYYYEDIAHLFRVALPFFHKWTHVPNDYEEIYQQALKEMQEPDFSATWTLLTAWGTRSHREPIRMRGRR